MSLDQQLSSALCRLLDQTGRPFHWMHAYGLCGGGRRTEKKDDEEEEENSATTYVLHMDGMDDGMDDVMDGSRWCTR